MADKVLMKGNEALAYGAIDCGADGYFGYPITPQSEVMETLMKEMPWETTGMVVLQAESETASINMVYGGACTGKKCMTSTSSPGISLMCEGLSYIAGAELPCVVINVVRGGPGLGTIQPGQGDYFQMVKGGGHGDYHAIVLSPASVQDMYDFVGEGFELAFKYSSPCIILADGVIGQMMEKLERHEQTPRWTHEEILKMSPWALTGKKNRPRNVITSLALEPSVMEATNLRLQAKYRKMEKDDVKFEEYKVEDAEYLIIAYGCMSRIGETAVDLAREQGIKVGLLRPITLYPYPTAEIDRLVPQMKSMMSIELSSGQMVEDVRLAVNGRIPVGFYGRMGGSVPSPEEILDAFVKFIK